MMTILLGTNSEQYYQSLHPDGRITHASDYEELFNALYSPDDYLLINSWFIYDFEILDEFFEGKKERYLYVHYPPSSEDTKTNKSINNMRRSLVKYTKYVHMTSVENEEEEKFTDEHIILLLGDLAGFWQTWKYQDSGRRDQLIDFVVKNNQTVRTL